ncbi:hypothetical protein FIBSPDRAFT_245032 [Athelia psychrophila]|uniref:F-box domain-containing protein n=1 Tax=Athelia psychrophila TaxID=1759441 RepID=A0A166RSS1_9AGAM|nr:hypothetical protein FIBSPDRAFT_245032 [Fibularhizoctonia sp. CBS 109695]
MVPSKYLKGWRMVPSHVCKRWRDLSLSTPIHWAYVSAEVKGVDEEKISRELECAQAWLARSGSCPLTIKVAYNGNQPAHWKRLMDFFLPCCDRWRHAKIFSSSKMPADLSSIKDKLPLLEALTLELPQPPKGAPFGNAPKLRQLKITLCDDERDDERDEGPGAVFVFPWSQLTHVKLRFLTEQECWWIMQKLHNVVSLAVGQFAAWGDPPQPHYQMLRLEHLKRLTFQWFKTNSGFAGFHEHLDVPSMTNYCYHDRLGATWSLPSFQSLLSRRSSCRLVSVSLILHTMEIDDLPLVLQCIPDVSHFDFNGHSMYVNQVQTLLTASPFLLPRLEHLTLHHDMYFNPHLLLAMIESRMVDYRCTRLRKVTISEFYDWRVLDEEVCERLEQLALTVRRETFQMSVSLHGTADGFRSEGWTSYGDAI